MLYTANGKPHAAGLPQFSIAHAGAWVLCALASDGAVGVDVEALAPSAALPRWLAVFDQEERAAARTARAALSIWTAKEATLKAAGARFGELAQVRYTYALYWRDLAPGQKIAVPLDVIARVPGEYSGPASRGYLYYNADLKHWVEPLKLTIAAKE